MTATVSTKPSPDFYTVGGTLNPTDPSYVVRNADIQLWEAIKRREYCYILTPRQMGKSSLMAHTAAQIRKTGEAAVVIDLTSIGTELSAETWYLGQVQRIARQLRLKFDFQTWWFKPPPLSVVQRFVNFFTDVVLDQITTPIVVFIDEIDTTLSLPAYSDDYFAVIRALYNDRAESPKLARLVFVLIGVASPSDLIKDSQRTPFNVGTRIQLADFTLQEAQPLAQGLAVDQRLGKKLLERVFFWTDGHPYLTQKTCKQIAKLSQSAVKAARGAGSKAAPREGRIGRWKRESEDWPLSKINKVVDQVISELFLSNSVTNTDDNLMFVRDQLLERRNFTHLLRYYETIKTGERIKDSELNPIWVALKLSGLIKATGNGILQVRNRIYDKVFDVAWIRQEQEALQVRHLLDSSFGPEGLKEFVAEHFRPIADNLRPDEKKSRIIEILIEYTRAEERTSHLLDLVERSKPGSVQRYLQEATSNQRRTVEVATFGRYHAFVVMPYGTKERIDFNRVYSDLIKPALEAAAFEVFRSDEEMRAGDIRTDMFQELLMADLVVADLSIDNPNVWYELGVRHALRARGVIGIRCRRDYMPFDVYTDRALTYQIKENPPGAAVPDPERLEEDKKKLAEFATETINSWYDRKVSPVYQLLPYLKEPHFKLLQVEGAKEFWSWAMRIEVARKGNRPGDILVFAEEAPNIGFRVEAYRSAGNGLRSLGQFALALDQYEKALALAPDDLESRRQKALLFGRLKQSDAAKEWLQDLVKDVPDDAESWALLGRVEKESWVGGWRAEGKTVEQMRQDAAADDALLQEAIDAYAKGFSKDPSHYYSGINAVGLMYLLAHLTGKEEQSELRKEMEGGVRWAVRAVLDKYSKDYWARATLAELEGLSNKKEVIEAALKSAVAVADKDWFKLNSSREQLLLYKDLGFRPAEVQSCLEIIDRALARVPRPESRWAPRQVFLFSGHMIDAPDRKDPRFPPDKEPIAAKAIADRLDALGAGAEDLAICSGACGGDLLFAEACLARGLRLELRIPFDEPTFLRNSVAFAPGNWTDRFYQVKGNPNTRLLVMPDELGPTPKLTNPYARDNLWQLYSALSWGPDKVRFICLWNRKGGDGPGGTEHMYETVQKYSGRVYVLDTNVLW